MIEPTAGFDASRLTLVYQPIVASGRRCHPVWYEALSRLTGPDGGLHSVGTLLEGKRGIEIERRIDLLTPGILRRDLLENGSMRASLNVSPVALADPRWSAQMRPLLQDPRLTRRVILEITERAKLNQAAMRTLLRIRASGVLIAFDDLTPERLRETLRYGFAPDILKIDKTLAGEFVAGRVGPISDFRRAGEDIGALVVAEGIETASAFHQYARHGIALQQGFFHGRPDSLDRQVTTCSGR